MVKKSVSYQDLCTISEKKVVVHKWWTHVKIHGIFSLRKVGV